MDWVNILLLMTLVDNLEDAQAAAVKGNETSKFAISNWTAYSNAKKMLCNAGEEGHIYAGKFEPFKKFHFLSMIGV